jgi:hypothetical protein
MKTVETVLRQLSDLYEFNKRLKTYSLQQPDAAEGAESRQESETRRSGAEASPAHVQDEAPST